MTPRRGTHPRHPPAITPTRLEAQERLRLASVVRLFAVDLERPWLIVRVPVPRADSRTNAHNLRAHNLLLFQCTTSLHRSLTIPVGPGTRPRPVLVARGRAGDPKGRDLVSACAAAASEVGADAEPPAAPGPVRASAGVAGAPTLEFGRERDVRAMLERIGQCVLCRGEGRGHGRVFVTMSWTATRWRSAAGRARPGRGSVSTPDGRWRCTRRCRRRGTRRAP